MTICGQTYSGITWSRLSLWSLGPKEDHLNPPVGFWAMGTLEKLCRLGRKEYGTKVLDVGVVVDSHKMGLS